MDSYDNFGLIGDESMMQDGFKFGDLGSEPGCFSMQEGDWDPFSASGSSGHNSTINDASIWSEELLSSIVVAEMVVESNTTDQFDGREAQMGPTEDNAGSFKSVMVIEGDKNIPSSKGESQADVISCNSENPSIEMVIGGESNGQTHEIESEVGPTECNCENLGGGEMVTKEELVIEASDIHPADSECTLHEPGPLGKCSPETELVIDKPAASGLMETSNKTEAVEKNIAGENTTDHNSKYSTCEVVIGGGSSTLDERECHVVVTGSNFVNLGGEMIIAGRSNVGLTEETLKSQIITEGRINGQSNEGERYASPTIDDSETLLYEVFVETDTHDQPGEGNRQVGPVSPSCDNLIEDAEQVTTGDINKQCNEVDCQAGTRKLLCSFENRSDALDECSGIFKSNHLIQESTCEVHEVPQGERNNQEEETATAVSHSEKHVEQGASIEVQKSVNEKNCAGSQLEFSFVDTGGKTERMKSELCGRNLSVSPRFSLCESVHEVALLDPGPLSSTSSDFQNEDKQDTTCYILYQAPASPSCDNLIGDAERVTLGDINRQCDEVDSQTGDRKLPLSSENRSDAALDECSGISKTNHLIQESTCEVNEVPQGERNTQEEETTTAVSHSEKHFEQVGPCELHKSVYEKNCVGSQLELSYMKTGGEGEKMRSELSRREFSVSPEFSLCEASVLEVAFHHSGPLSSTSSETHFREDKQGGYQMEKITGNKEAERTAIEDYHSTNHRLHNPVELPTSGCSSSVELIMDPSYVAASAEKHDENKGILNENVLIHSNCEVENTILCNNSDLSLGQSMHRDGVTSFLATNLACEIPSVVEAEAKSPAGMGTTELNDVITTVELQAIQPVQVNCVKSDSMDQMLEEISVTYENSLSMHEIPSSITGLECKSDSLGKKIKETTVAETVPDTELHGSRNGMREHMNLSTVIQPIEVKAVESLDRTIDEEAYNNDNNSENSTMNDFNVEDTGPEPSADKLLPEAHGDARSVDGIQEIDKDGVSFDHMQKKGDEETNGKDACERPEILNDATCKNVGPTLFSMEISSECHVDAGPIDCEPVQSDALEEDAEDGVLSVNPLMEKITEEGSAVSLPTELKISAAAGELGSLPSVVKTSFESIIDTSPFTGIPIQLENKMEGGISSGNLLSEKFTEEKCKNTPTMEVESSFVPLKVSPVSGMDATLIDRPLLQPEDEKKDADFSDGLLNENRGEAKSSETSEFADDAKMVESVKTSETNDEISDTISDAKIDSTKNSARTNDEVTPVDFLPIQSDHVIDDGKRSDEQGVVQLSGLEGEYSGAMNQRSEAVIGSLVEDMRPGCEPTPVKKQGLGHIDVISTDCVPTESDAPVSSSHIEGEDSGDANKSDAIIKTSEVIGDSFKDAKSSSADKLSQKSEIEDASTLQLEVVQCTLTESKEPKPGLLEHEGGKTCCSTSACSLPEETVTVTSLGAWSQNVGPSTIEEPQVIVSENVVRKDSDSLESPALTSGTAVDDKTDLRKKHAVSRSKVHLHSPSKSGEIVHNGTCVEKNAELPDLNMPHSVTIPSQESLTETQQMQLRAQIFVYFSLMEGSLPVEAYMARSFGESERCLWEPIWRAYSETLKNRSPLNSDKTPTFSDFQLKKSSTQTIQNDTHFSSQHLDWSPSLSSNSQFSPWLFSLRSQARNEPSQPFMIRFESEESSKRKRSFSKEASSPSQNYVCRNADVAAATNKVKPDFIVENLPVLVRPVMTYAGHFKKEIRGLKQEGSSCADASLVPLQSTIETNNVMLSSSLEWGPNVELIASFDRERPVLSHAALHQYQLQPPARHCQIAPALSCVLADQSSQQTIESSSKGPEVFSQNPGLWKTVASGKCSSSDPRDEVATAVVVIESVAKAAAAAKLASEAAKLASEAALQAELLADEAMGLIDSNPGLDPNTFQVGMESEMVTPAKVLISKDKVHGSHAIISAMREASKRRVKLASAANRKAENIDTILRAAEMAAEAVSQVGLVVKTGDPLPFCIADMVETIGGVHLRAAHREEAEVSRKGKVVDMDLAINKGSMVAQASEVSMRDAVPLSLGKSELIRTGDNTSVETGENVIKKGSRVEVTGEKEGLIGVWFGAIVLDLKDGMAHIRYTDLPSCKEGWVPLERESGVPPMLRLAHPVNAKYDGRRKRRRENVSSYSWSVGDHVDAWMRDGWWECIITSKHADEAKYTVRSPGESLVVGEWDLRPSLVWKEGIWVEWVRVKESSEFSKGDSPLEKRQRVGPAPCDTETAEPKCYLSRITKIPRPHFEYARDSTSLGSGANPKKEESVSEPKRTGPRVCFGVPRPNKKTKFVEVAQVSEARLVNGPTLVPNSIVREKCHKPLTKIPKPTKEPLSSSRLKGPERDLTKVRGKKPMTEPVTSKRPFSSTILGSQNGTTRRKGVLNIGTRASNRIGKTEVPDVERNEPRRSGRNVKPTSRLLEGLETGRFMSKIPGAGSAKGLVSLKAGPTPR